MRSPVSSASTVGLLLATIVSSGACARAVTTAPSQAPERPASAATAPARPTSSPVIAALTSARAERVADSLLALMTLDEKLGQLAQMTGRGTQTGPAAPEGGEAQIRAGRVGTFLNIHGAAVTRELQRIAVEESRLHVPLLFALDVIHGFRTIFPVPLAEAASFDPANAERAARVAATEGSAHGLHWTFAPMVDIARDPRWGRIVEGSGEDPYLGSVMAAARVRGFQGDDLAAPNALLATAKHFAVYGAAEGGRDYASADVSERTIWEIYFPPFQAAVRAGVGSLMASFNDIGGTPAHASRWLLDDVLRRRWGFAGIVVSDWAGIEELIPHGVAASKEEAGVLALTAGVDVDMVDGIYADSLPAAQRAGRLPMAAIDSSVRRLLRVKYALGLFDDPYRRSDTTRERTMTLTAEHVAAAREAGRRAIVLLKNDARTLPLRKDLRTIAVIGPLAESAQTVLGNWAAEGKAADAVSVLAGLRAAAGGGTRVLYARGAPVDTADTSGFAEAARLARSADAVVLVLGERENMSAEAASRASIELPGAQLRLAQRVLRAARASAGGATKPVVAVLMNGRPLATPWLADSVPALVESWFLGVQHGNALADVLFGDYNPGGKLPVTVPRATGQVPIHYNHRNTGRPPAAEDHFTSKYIDVPWTPLYPFGHGLSYTTFDYRDLQLSAAELRAGDTLGVSVTVANSGDRAGDEVVQLYLRDDAASVARPVRELKRFERITLRPGESRTVRFAIGAEEMALYDVAMRRVVEPGAFTVFVGTSSADTREARFRVTGDTLVLAPAPPRIR